MNARVRWIPIGCCVVALLGASPAERPTVPPLIVGPGSNTAFVLNGMIGVPPAGGYAFRVATNGRRHLVTIYDPSDGTPLCISDGTQSLVYDLEFNRVLLIPNSFGEVNFRYDHGSEKPIAMDFGVLTKNDPADPDPTPVTIRIDKYLAAETRMRLSGSDGDGAIYRLAKPGHSAELYLPRNDPTWFTFSALDPAKPASFLQIKASSINGQVPDAEVTFPDMKSLKTSMGVRTIADKDVKAFVDHSAKQMLMKLGCTGGRDVRESATKRFPEANWEALAARDKRLGSQYRAALKACGLTFDHQTSKAATRPGS